MKPAPASRPRRTGARSVTLTLIALAAGMACLFASASENAALRTQPLFRGTLWWIIDAPGKAWTKEALREAITRQRDAGFDLLWILNTPELLKQAIETETQNDAQDVMRTVHEIADEYGMHVLADLPKGGWYGTNSADEMIDRICRHARGYFARYGRHKSLYGWYLNHEINPIAAEDTAQTAFWQRVWQESVQCCHELAPQTLVTISPFFLLDKDRKRGFVYQTPGQYADWWGDTLLKTGIDVLMLQDSGEHLGFFSLEDRRPFWEAAAAACARAGAQFWLNVESGEADVPDWETYLRMEAEKTVPWRVTPMPWLIQKLCAAARIADGIVNWGYFPFMDPLAGKPEASAAYKAYTAWHEQVRSRADSPCIVP